MLSDKSRGVQLLSRRYDLRLLCQPSAGVPDIFIIHFMNVFTPE